MPEWFVCTCTDELVLIGARYYVRAIAYFGNGIENYTTYGYAREEESKKGMDWSQITWASSSYARKYALNGLFAIDDTVDSDWTNTHGKDDEKPKAPEAPVKKVDASLINEEQLDLIREFKKEFDNLSNKEFLKWVSENTKDKKVEKLEDIKNMSKLDWVRVINHFWKEAYLKYATWEAIKSEVVRKYLSWIEKKNG
jgi:hypothetical protein